MTSHMRLDMVWPVHEAKARFSAMLDACTTDGPQIVTRRGTEAAVLVPIEDWRRLTSTARPTLRSLLLDDRGRGELDLPPRGRARRRPPTPVV